MHRSHINVCVGDSVAVWRFYLIIKKKKICLLHTLWDPATCTTVFRTILVIRGELMWSMWFWSTTTWLPTSQRGHFPRCTLFFCPLGPLSGPSHGLPAWEGLTLLYSATCIIQFTCNIGYGSLAILCSNAPLMGQLPSLLALLLLSLFFGSASIFFVSVFF